MSFLMGHQVRLISPQFVKPYVKSNKNDRNDAEAICEAAGRPSRRFVPAKSAEQLVIESNSIVCCIFWVSQSEPLSVRS